MRKRRPGVERKQQVVLRATGGPRRVVEVRVKDEALIPARDAHPNHGGGGGFVTERRQRRQIKAAPACTENAVVVGVVLGRGGGRAAGLLLGTSLNR